MNTIATHPARAYRPCWTHHPRGGKVFGFACKTKNGERGIATTEENARAGNEFTTCPAAQVFRIENPPTLKIAPHTLDRIATASLQIHDTEHVFVRPHDDQTGQIEWMKILNSGLAYAITHQGRYALANLRSSTSASVTEILSVHDTPESMRASFFTEQANRRMTHY